MPHKRSVELSGVGSRTATQDVSGYCSTLADEVRHKMSVELLDTGR